MKKKIKHANAISRVRKYFPQVNEVKDSKKSVAISVTSEDSVRGTKRKPNECALARACVRTGMADGAIIGIAYSYLIKGDKATRYSTSVSVGREITSFDRHQDFAVGRDYVLSKIAKTNQLGRHISGPSGPNPGKTRPPSPLAVHAHRTERIRVLKGRRA